MAFSSIHESQACPLLSLDFTPDSKYVLSGSANSKQNIFIWNLETGQQVNLMQFHPSTQIPVRCVKFSHVYCMLVTACQNVVVWIPGSIV